LRLLGIVFNMTKLKDISIIMAHKNRLTNLKYCLASIDSCVYTPSVVLVDFGSNFDVRNVLDWYEKCYKWLKVVKVDRNTKLFHKSRALNIGIRAAETKYVCMTDVDQIFQPNFYSIFAKEISNENFIRCKTQFLSHLPKISPKNLNLGIYRELLVESKKDPQRKSFGEGCCHGVSRDWLLSVNGYDEKYIGWGYEDNDLVYRAKESGYDMFWVDSLTSMIHLPHPRDVTYFSNKLISANKAYFIGRHKRSIIANSGKQWGKI